MKLHRAAGALALLGTLLAGCDDGGTEPGIVTADLAGSWDASSFRYTDANDPSLSFDIITQAQGTLHLDIAESGAFNGQVRIPGVTVHPETGETITVDVAGTIEVTSSTTVDVDFDAATEAMGLFSDFTATFTLNEARTQLTWTNPDTSFDFPDALEGDNPRGSVDAVLVVVLEK